MFYDLEFGAGTGVIYYVPSATACVEDQQFRLFDCLSSSPNCTHTNTDMGISCAPCEFFSKICSYIYTCS